MLRRTRSLGLPLPPPPVCFHFHRSCQSFPSTPFLFRYSPRTAEVSFYSSSTNSSVSPYFLHPSFSYSSPPRRYFHRYIPSSYSSSFPTENFPTCPLTRSPWYPSHSSPPHFSFPLGRYGSRYQPLGQTMFSLPNFQSPQTHFSPTRIYSSSFPPIFPYSC